MKNELEEEKHPESRHSSLHPSPGKPELDLNLSSQMDYSDESEDANEAKSKMNILSTQLQHTYEINRAIEIQKRQHLENSRKSDRRSSVSLTPLNGPYGF